MDGYISLDDINNSNYSPAGPKKTKISDLFLKGKTNFFTIPNDTEWKGKNINDKLQNFNRDKDDKGNPQPSSGTSGTSGTSSSNNAGKNAAKTALDAAKAAYTPLKAAANAQIVAAKADPKYKATTVPAAKKDAVDAAIAAIEAVIAAVKEDETTDDNVGAYNTKAAQINAAADKLNEPPLASSWLLDTR